MNIGKPIALEDFAATITEGLSDAEKIMVMRSIGMGVSDGSFAAMLIGAADEIGRYAHMIGRDHPQRRSDGSIIHPYAPGGGPVRANG